MKFCLIVLSIFCFALVPQVVSAQEEATSEASTADTSLGIANYKPITDSSAKDGDIISSSNRNYILSKLAYDPNIVGVITSKAAIMLAEEALEGAQPVMSNGTALVNVSAKNGGITKGDLITTSDTPGVGMKATKSGYVLGTALEDFDTSDSEGIGQIAVSLNIHFNSLKATTGGSLKDFFSLSTLAATESPTLVFKYFMAGLVIVASVGAGLFMFGRTANKGLEALGRNPMAQKIIEMGMFINVVLAVVVVGAGVFIASLILKF
ncbi:hypothetical protein A3C26_00470 [Candidatus Daviesbacteria bacterium RIFCSPHIGHO2_02_FULL_39_12]|uniref:Uncharacterized protein n=2 Tax=Candidatus Daviesiibacteriota TaxID=1752718 RepID=A0A1F5J8K7_9BACT|nr:MAG: hypothetical protein A3C26_00470 [Candidatus Daviesbacteria bacterium RIFCSPHIGHO2_02_FULL_39_12]OGE72319.1 MAG: hypothetical protein A3H40_02400 [Candidatus Daviesbacteria bacterium RIFCSPLOWO2_02_FULL_38_15]